VGGSLFGAEKRQSLSAALGTNEHLRI